MRIGSSLLAAAFAVVAMIASAEQPAPAPKKPEWTPIFSNAERSYEYLTSSVELDSETQSVQLLMRTTLAKPIKSPEGMAKFMVEQTVILCKQRVVISTGMLFYDEKNKHISTTTGASVYEDDGQPGYVITELVKFACGPETDQKEQKPGFMKL